MSCMMPEESSKCFADVSISNCSILKQKECENCNFFKTKKQYREDRYKYFEKEAQFKEYSDIAYGRMLSQLTKED